MNISSFSKGTYNGTNKAGTVYAGNLLMGRKPALKSTQDKLKRQQKTQKQIDFFDAQKEKLKAMECFSVEEIAGKLKMLHSYEDQIAAVKKQYNGEQMFHVLDEAAELGEKIAEAAEKNAPKTEEERKEEMVKEALGLDENEGAMDKALDELTEELEQVQDEMVEEAADELEQSLDEVIEDTDDIENIENINDIENIKETSTKNIDNVYIEENSLKELKEKYKPINVLI